MAQSLHNYKVVVIAPIHRAWGNRICRETRTLDKAGYHVTAFVGDAHDSVENSREFIVVSAKNRFTRILKLPGLFYKALRLNADIYHLHNPDMLPLAFLLKLTGRKVIYDTHEDFSRRLLSRDWIPRLLRKPMSLMVSAAEKLISHMVDATFVTQDRLVERFSSKTHLILNAPYITDETRDAVESLYPKIKLTPADLRLIYVGDITVARGLFNMLDALQKLNNQTQHIRLILVGPMNQELLTRASKHTAWEYVDYQGLVPQELAFAYMKYADLGLCMLSDIGDHRMATPNKILEYTAWNLPFVASNFSHWKSLFDINIGVWLDPDNSGQLVDSIQDIINFPTKLDDMIKQSCIANSKITWDEELNKMLIIYKKILTGK